MGELRGLVSRAPHTLDIKHGLLFTEGGVSLQLHHRDAALSGRVFTVGFRRILRRFFTVLLAQWVAGRCRPVGCYRA